MVGFDSYYHFLDFTLISKEICRHQKGNSGVSLNDTLLKELSFCHKLKSSNPNIFAASWCKALIFQILIVLSISINSLKYLRSSTLGYKDIEIRKSEYVAKIKFLSGSAKNILWLLTLFTKNVYRRVWEEYKQNSFFRFPQSNCSTLMYLVNKKLWFPGKSIYFSTNKNIKIRHKNTKPSWKGIVFCTFTGVVRLQE